MSRYIEAERWDKDIPLPDPRSNRPVRFIHRIEAALMFGLYKLIGNMSVDRAARYVGNVMQATGPLVRKANAQGHRNLQLVYPDMTKAERSEILKNVWWNMGAIGGEFAHLPALIDRTTIKNPEALEPYTVEGGQQAIFFAGHFANWEAIGIAMHHANVPYGVVYRAANNPIIDAEIIKRRAVAMSRWQVPKGRRGGREFLDVLNKGLSICIMGDQKFNDGVSVPFLGHPAMTATAAARTSIKRGIPLIPLHLVRHPESRFELIVGDPVDIELSGHPSKDIERTCAAMNDALGRFVLERPDQWLWLHRRWPKQIAG